MIWYPYEQMKTMKTPYKIVDAEGVYLYTEDNKMIDSISSWWSTIHGYKHPVITKAIKDQADKFSHVMLGGLTHDPALQLSAKLADWLPGDLDHCFFSDSGSVGVEVALKMALQYYVNQNESIGTAECLPRGYVQGYGGRRRRGLSFYPGGVWRKEVCYQYPDGDLGS